MVIWIIPVFNTRSRQQGFASCNIQLIFLPQGSKASEGHWSTFAIVDAIQKTDQVSALAFLLQTCCNTGWTPQRYYPGLGIENIASDQLVRFGQVRLPQIHNAHYLCAMYLLDQFLSFTNKSDQLTFGSRTCERLVKLATSSRV